MKIKTLLLAVALMIGATANAQSLSDILSGLSGSSSGTTSTITNLIEGIFTNTNLTLSDIVGEYEATGPAVAFQSDNLLQKAGGIAGAAALETKLEPYYTKYGLIGMPLTIDSDGKFTMKVKGITLSGTVTESSEKGLFTFNITAGGTLKIGQFTSYIQKSGTSLDLMFDAEKMKQLLSTVAKFSGSSIVSTVGSLLDSYEGAYIGFKMTKTGSGSTTTTTTTTTTDTTTTTQSGIGTLLNILKSKSN